MRQTGEVFQTYEEYLQRLRLLHSKQWSSQISGRNGLNFEEAAHEESNVDALIAKARLHQCVNHSVEPQLIPISTSDLGFMSFTPSLQMDIVCSSEDGVKPLTSFNMPTFCHSTHKGIHQSVLCA